MGYYTFDSQSGNQVSDLSVNQSQGYLVNGPTIQTGQFGQSVSVDGFNDQVNIPSGGSMTTLNQNSHSISMWIKPDALNTEVYTEGRLHAHGFLRGIDNTYYTNIESLLAINPSGSNFLTVGPSGRGLDFNNANDYRLSLIHI